MTDQDAFRNKAEKCRELAAGAGDPEIERQLKGLADEYEAKAMKAAAAGKSSPDPGACKLSDD